MKESRASRSGRDRKAFLSPDADRLVASALGLANSGSRVEDRYWEMQLQARLDRLLDGGHAQTVEQALERLQQTDQEAYGALVEAVEESAESTLVTVASPDGSEQVWQVLLVSAPLICWTRFKIPAKGISAARLKTLSQAWSKHILAEGTRFVMVPQLYSIDQLPNDFNQVRRLVRKLGDGAVSQAALKFDLKDLPESADMLADVRFLIGVVAAPVSAPVFRWQQIDAKDHSSRVSCLEAWVEHARPIIDPLLAGCGFECLLPDAFHINMRESDRRVRPFAIRAGVHYLTHAFSREAKELKAVIAGFGSQRIEEYRISLCLDKEGEQVAQGIVWPILGPELLSEGAGADEEEPTQLEVIRALLGECGVEEITHWNEISEPEFCEDCGAPLFPNMKAEVVHTELPDELEPGTQHFH
jgi:hypothetical protein